MNVSRPRHDLPQILFSSLCILILLSCVIWILYPFLLSALWAGVIVIATWPLFLTLERKTGQRKGLAIAVMMLFMTAVFVLPIIFTAGVFSLLMEQFLQWLTQLDMTQLPELDFLGKIPVIGTHVHKKWLSLSTGHADTLLHSLKPWVTKIIVILMNELTHFTSLVVNGVMMLIACLVFYLHGQHIERGLRRFASRLARERGESAVILAGKTIQAVATGVVLTAVLQAAFAGIGLALFQIPSSAMLTGIIFVLCLMQLGPIVIMIPAVVWLFHSGNHWSGGLLLLWTIVAGSLDNVLKPLFLRRSTDTSLLLMMLGVIGGMLTWGIIGIMVGPVILAVTWKLLATWVSESDTTPSKLTKELS